MRLTVTENCTERYPFLSWNLCWLLSLWKSKIKLNCNRSDLSLTLKWLVLVFLEIYVDYCPAQVLGPTYIIEPLSHQTYVGRPLLLIRLVPGLAKKLAANKQIKNVLEISFEWDNDTVILTDCKWRTESFDPSASFVQQSPARSERRGSHSQEPIKIS